MKIEATINFYTRYYEEIAKCLKPDVSKLEKRAKAKISSENEALKIEITSKDLTAFRAMINSIIKELKIAQEVFESL